MTKPDVDWSELIPVCDCVAMKRKIQAEIYEETKHMTREERREYNRQASERLWADIERRRAERRAAESRTRGADHEHQQRTTTSRYTF